MELSMTILYIMWKNSFFLLPKYYICEMAVGKYGKIDHMRNKFTP